MALNVSMIYRRTDRGVREVYEKSHQFTQSERLILILLDGRLNVGGLKLRLPSLNDERIERAMRKLQDAGLVEPMGQTGQTRTNGSGVLDAARLEPEAVAQFLEQTELDPITIFGDSDAAVASELVRARVEQAAAQLTRDALSAASAEASPRSVSGFASSTKAPRESVRSQDSRLIRPSTTTQAPDWDAEATRFAITTVNVPDRLDLQEERDRADLDDFADHRRRVALRAWMKRLLVFAVVAVLLAGAVATLQPLRNEVSAGSVASRLTTVFKQPVTVADTEFRFSPTPRMIVRGIAVGDIKADEASLLINWRDLWSAIRGGNWVWSEGTVAPISLTAQQAQWLAGTLPGGANELPSKISTVRFESIRVSESPLMPGRYEATLRRGDDGKFGPLVIRELDIDGTMRMTLRPVRNSEGRQVLDFRLDADRWQAPFGPRVRWSDVRANGRLDAQLLEVSSYTLGGFFGVVGGALYAAHDTEWVVTGNATVTNLDIEAVLQSLRPANQEAPAAFQGTARMELALVGRGATLDDALALAVAAGPFQVRWATVNGINLGMAAAQGAIGGGVTRFTEFGGVLGASRAGVRFEDTGGRAGALAVKGDFTVAPDLSLAGTVHVELGGQRVQAPITLRVRGTVLAPRFGP